MPEIPEPNEPGWFIPTNQIANGDFDWCACAACDCWNVVDDTGDICQECVKGNHYPEEADKAQERV